jgi:hypothetical protein
MSICILGVSIVATVLLVRMIKRSRQLTLEKVPSSKPLGLNWFGIIMFSFGLLVLLVALLFTGKH